MYWLSCFLGALGLCCCVRVAVSGRGERGLPFLAAHRPRCRTSRGAPAPRCEGVSGSGTQAQLLRGRWCIPGPGGQIGVPCVARPTLNQGSPGAEVWTVFCFFLIERDLFKNQLSDLILD